MVKRTFLLFAAFFRFLSLEEFPHVACNHAAVLFMGEMPRIEHMHFDVPEITLVRFGALGPKISSFFPHTTSVGGWYFLK